MKRSISSENYFATDVPSTLETAQAEVVRLREVIQSCRSEMDGIAAKKLKAARRRGIDSLTAQPAGLLVQVKHSCVENAVFAYGTVPD